eukprot:CAMPEP_0115183988 /NCGR_PEP_ID=MMETSP0270-20121206/8732_1 /TAXON_ID=71861 /ORGANISM="Scrippsiella trochoidea, Strain CCMP3099" /LENGTH=75 /DNA_ID=CAMNT_0002597063 /DNA_START=300 /DNA_END=524 /DNA_ORIENTATION=+
MRMCVPHAVANSWTRAAISSFAASNPASLSGGSTGHLWKSSVCVQPAQHAGQPRRLGTPIGASTTWLALSACHDA